MTEPGTSYNGCCLLCHPDKDPDGGRTARRRRKGTHNYAPRHTNYPNNNIHYTRRDEDTSNRPNRVDQHHDHHRHRSHHHHRHSGPATTSQDQDTNNRTKQRVNSLPAYTKSKPIRQGRNRDLPQSLPANLRDQQQDSTDYLQYYDDDVKHYDNYEEDLHQPRRDLEEVDYIEVKEKNIFGEEVIIRKPKRRSNRTKPWKNGRRGTTESIGRQNSPPIQPSHNHQQRSHGLHTSAPLPDEYEEEKVEEEAPDENNFSPPASPQTDMRSVSKTNNNHHVRGSPALQYFTINEEDGTRSTTEVVSITETTEQLNMSKMSLDSEESMDALAKLCAQHIKKNPQTPNIMDQLGGNTVLPNSELQLAQHPDDMTVLSDMTKETYFPGSVAGTVQTRQRSRNLNNSLGAISENTGASVTSGGPSVQRSLTSHEINEPVVPSETTTNYTTQNNMDTYDYIESTSPHLMTLQVIVGECTEAGNDEEAIDVVTQSLIHDNATSMNKDVALFCLTTLWASARKSDALKRKIIFEDATFDAIIETMQIYRETSVDIQTRACGVLWSLSMAPADRKHVAQLGGCEAVLNAMLAHVNVVALQVMALGALKVLSFDNISKNILRSRGALSIVGDVMQKHLNNPTIQSEGCVTLGNLSVDSASQSVIPVSLTVIDVIIKAMLGHPDSLEVHESACFTLMSLASSSDNVRLIRTNDMSRLALELSLQKFPDQVGINILNLLRRLRFDD